MATADLLDILQYFVGSYVSGYCLGYGLLWFQRFFERST